MGQDNPFLPSRPCLERGAAHLRGSISPPGSSTRVLIHRDVHTAHACAGSSGHPLFCRRSRHPQPLPVWHRGARWNPSAPRNAPVPACPPVSPPSTACESLPVGSLPQHTPADTHTQPLGVIQALPGVWISVTTYQQGREREFKPVSPSASPPFPVSPPAFGRSAGTAELRAPRCKVTPRAMWSRKICARKTGLVSAEPAGVPGELSEGRQAGRKQTGGFPEQPPSAGPRCARCARLDGAVRGSGFGVRGSGGVGKHPRLCAAVPPRVRGARRCGCFGKHCGAPWGPRRAVGVSGHAIAHSLRVRLCPRSSPVPRREPQGSYPAPPVSGSCSRSHGGHV